MAHGFFVIVLRAIGQNLLKIVRSQTKMDIQLFLDNPDVNSMILFDVNKI